MKMQILFVVSCITFVLCVGQEDESQSPPSYKTKQPWRYQAQNPVPKTSQNYYAKRFSSEICRSQEQCYAEDRKYLGSACVGQSGNDECAIHVKNSQCDRGHCACQSGFVDFDLIACLPFVNLNEKCSTSSQCHAPGSECDNEGLCVCKKGFLLKTDRRQSYCIPEKKPSEACKYDEECTIENSSCNSSVCQCNEGFVEFQSKCLLARQLGESCQVDKECVDVNSECKNSVCSCDLRSVAVSNGRNRRSRCMPIKKLGEACSSDEQCKKKSEDHTCQNRQCECQEGLLNVANQVCLPANVKIGEACFVSAQCLAPIGSQGRIGCYVEPRSAQSLCLVEGEAFRGGYGYRYNQPTYTKQPYNRRDYQTPKYGQKEEENDDNEGEYNDNDQSKKSVNKYKVKSSNNDEEYEDGSYQTNYLHSKVSMKPKSPNQDQSEAWKTDSSDEEETEDDSSSTQITKMPSKSKSSKVSENDDKTSDEQTTSGSQEVRQTKSPLFNRWAPTPRKPVYNQ